MSLYLAIFDGDDDVEGWVLGSYSDFACFRDTVAARLPSAGYPVLMTHSDCDGEWAIDQLPLLRRELESIAAAFLRLPPEEPQQAFEQTAKYRQGARALYDCFHNVDGENLFEALLRLCNEGINRNLPIVFQ